MTTRWVLSRLTTLRAVRRDEGLELEVTDPKDEVQEGKAREREGKDILKSEGLQCR